MSVPFSPEKAYEAFGNRKKRAAEKAAARKQCCVHIVTDVVNDLLADCYYGGRDLKHQAVISGDEICESALSHPAPMVLDVWENLVLRKFELSGWIVERRVKKGWFGFVWRRWYDWATFGGSKRSRAEFVFSRNENSNGGN